VSRPWQGSQLQERALDGRHEAQLDPLRPRAEAIRGQLKPPELAVGVATFRRAVDDAEVARPPLELTRVGEFARDVVRILVLYVRERPCGNHVADVLVESYDDELAHDSNDGRW
jgi:hypothetical protein